MGKSMFLGMATASTFEAGGGFRSVISLVVVMCFFFLVGVAS